MSHENGEELLLFLPPTCQGYSPKSASTVVPAGVLGSVPESPCFFLLILLIFLTISEAAGSLSSAFNARSEEKTGMKTNTLVRVVLLPRSASCLSCRRFRMSSFLILL